MRTLLKGMNELDAVRMRARVSWIAPMPPNWGTRSRADPSPRARSQRNSKDSQGRSTDALDVGGAGPDIGAPFPTGPPTDHQHCEPRGRSADVLHVGRADVVLGAPFSEWVPSRLGPLIPVTADEQLSSWKYVFQRQ